LTPEAREPRTGMSGVPRDRSCVKGVVSAEPGGVPKLL